MAHKDILSEISSLADKQTILLKKKQLFNEINNELSKLIDHDKNNKDLKALLTHIKTFINILNLWQELNHKTNERISKIQKLISQAENNEFLEIEYFVKELDSLINNIAYRSFRAFNINKFEELVNKLSYKDKITAGYIKEIKNSIESYDKILEFFEEVQKSASKYKYYHLKYELQLSNEEQLKEIYFIEKELKNVKDGEYKVADDRLIQTVQRLLKEFPDNKKAQQQAIEKIKQYKPLEDYPVSNKSDKNDSKIVDF